MLKQNQLADLKMAKSLPSFERSLENVGQGPMTRSLVSTLQLNLGMRCNQSCVHCHVGAGPHRQEVMSKTVAQQIGLLIDRSPSLKTVDITGGAPELNPNFKWLVEKARARELTVIDRCNLTVLLEPGMESMADFLSTNQVEIVASLPCYTQENVDKQRGAGTFGRSLEALRRLNQIGYGVPGSGLVLNLVYNSGGAFLPGSQAGLEQDYKDTLANEFGIRFDHLLTIVNMPIQRFAHQLSAAGQMDAYMTMLVDAFNPQTVPNLMCRQLVSVSFDGQLYDCDFNQMLNIPLGSPSSGKENSVFEIVSLDALKGQPIATAEHCFGCTAGAGSSCQGALQSS